MRKLISVFGIVLAISGSVVLADIDLSDFDDDVMRTMDDTNKNLEPDINAKNAAAAKEGAEIIQQGLKWTEEYFANKGTAPDGVKFAQEGEQHVAELLQFLAKNDFEKAAASSRALTKNCRTCHDAYKPLTK